MFTLRVVEFVVTGEQLGTTAISDLSMILVPLISMWGTIPLFYFLMIEHLIMCWCKMLKRHMVHHRDATAGSRLTLKFYYRKFISLCALQVGTIFRSVRPHRVSDLAAIF